MKRFVIREVETLKTTAAFYGCDCCCQFNEVCVDGNGIWCCNPDGSISIVGAS